MALHRKSNKRDLKEIVRSFKAANYISAISTKGQCFVIAFGA